MENYLPKFMEKYLPVTNIEKITDYSHKKAMIWTLMVLTSTEYDFLRTHEWLGDRIMLLGLGGSYAYGTNNKDSDIDLRG